MAVYLGSNQVDTLSGQPVIVQATLQDKTVSPTTSQQTITADTGYDGLDEVTVNAISPIKNSSDLVVSGATITTPAGYYSTDASASVSSMTLPTAASASATTGYTSKATIGRSTSAQYINIPPGYNTSGAYYTVSAVANGTAGTPFATKGSVSNHSISVTPKVTNTAGYITTSGTINGTAVSVAASELVSGTLSITSNGTKTVTNYASATVNVPGDSSTMTNTGGTSTITFSGLEGKPVAFCVFATGSVTTNNKIILIAGRLSTTTVWGFRYSTSNGAVYSSSDYGVDTQTSSMLKLTCSGSGRFNSGTYRLVYGY